jgi:hypothetical protein
MPGKIALTALCQGHPLVPCIEQDGSLQCSASGGRELKALDGPIPAFLRVRHGHSPNRLVLQCAKCSAALSVRIVELQAVLAKDGLRTPADGKRPAAK